MEEVSGGEALRIPMGDWQRAARTRLLYGRCRTRPAWRWRGHTAASLTCHQVIAELTEHILIFILEVQDDLVEVDEEVADSGEVEGDTAVDLTQMPGLLAEGHEEETELVVDVQQQHGCSEVGSWCLLR